MTEKNKDKKISRAVVVPHLSKMTTEASTNHFLGGVEAIPKGDCNSDKVEMESLNFERVTNSYSIATRRAQLVDLGLLPKPVDSERTKEDLEQSDRDGYFNSLRLSVNIQQQLKQWNHKRRQQQKFHFPSIKQLTRWILTISAGILCGLVAIFILFCVQRINAYRDRRIKHNLGVAGDSENEFWQYALGFLEYAGVNLALALASSAVCLWFAPSAVGSGIPEVKAYLNGVCVPHFAKFEVFLAKIFGTIFSVTSGLIIGPEGPLVHIGAIIGQGITKTAGIERLLVKEKSEDQNEETTNLIYGSTDRKDKNHENYYNTTKKKLPNIVSRFLLNLSQFRNDHERRDLISIGVACGFACIFGAPVGGLLYSMEEASSYLSVPIMWRTLVATALGTLMISVYYGSLARYSILNLGVHLSSGENALNASKFLEVPLYILIAVASGLLGALFNANYEYINSRRKKFYESPRISHSNYRTLKLLEVAAVSLLTSILTYGLPIILPWACTRVDEAAGYGENIIDSGSTDDVHESRWNCARGAINEIGSIMLGSRDDAMNEILTDPNVFEARTLLTCGLTFYFLMLITFGIDMPTGMFMPTLLTGCNLGGWAGIIIQQHIMSTVDPATFALLGATGMLAGMQRTTVSLVVIMMEATGRMKVLIPLIVTVIFARYVGDLFNDGIYHIGIHLKEYPYRDLYVKSGYDIADVTHIMTTPVVTLKEIETVEHLVRILKTTTHNGFPVIDKTKTFVGLIRRDQIVALIECGIYCDESSKASTCEESSFFSANNQDDNLHDENSALVGAPQKPRKHSRNDSEDVGMRPENEWYRDSVLKHKVRGGRRVLHGTSEILPGGTHQLRNRTRVHLGDHGCLVVDAPREEAMQQLDIGAAMNRGARSVMERCPISQAYILYASCGLRHLTVLGSGGQVTGIITRKNLDPEFLEEMTGIGRND